MHSELDCDELRRVRVGLAPVEPAVPGLHPEDLQGPILEEEARKVKHLQFRHGFMYLLACMILPNPTKLFQD